MNTGMLLRGIPIKPVGNVSQYALDYALGVQRGLDPTDFKQLYRVWARGRAQPPKGMHHSSASSGPSVAHQVFGNAMDRMLAYEEDAPHLRRLMAEAEPGGTE